jgi:hypothetical protein
MTHLQLAADWGRSCPSPRAFFHDILPCEAAIEAYRNSDARDRAAHARTERGRPRSSSTTWCNRDAAIWKEQSVILGTQRGSPRYSPFILDAAMFFEGGGSSHPLPGVGRKTHGSMHVSDTCGR